MSEPITIPPALYWRWKHAEAQCRAIAAQNDLRMAQAQQKFADACQAMAAAAPGFDPLGNYRTDDEACSVTPVEP